LCINATSFRQRLFCIAQKKGFSVGINFNHGNTYKLNILTMGNLLYIIAVVLIIFWLLGFFVYSAGGLIHILLVFAIIAILFRVIKGDKAV
jgi:hypothetical protein